MTAANTIAHSEAMLGFHDPTLGPDAKSSAEADDFLSTLLDIVNPLQHIPLVSTLYRDITGDEISPTASIVGGGLFGGPIGLASASANAIFEQASGDDLVGHALAMFSDEAGPELLPQQAGEIHQQADLGTTPPAAATSPATVKLTAADDEQIFWSGPSAIASLTPKPAPRPAANALAQSGAVPVANPAPAAGGATIEEVSSPGTSQSNGPAMTASAGTDETDAFLRALPANWVNEALRDAESLNAALQNGAAPEPATAKPWVGNAMLDALAKYEALTRARADAGNPTHSR